MGVAYGGGCVYVDVVVLEVVRVVAVAVVVVVVVVGVRQGRGV